MVSHLGAVVNFAAGELARAPAMIQRLGLEWLWRIKEEPGLWRRYTHDAIVFFGLLIHAVLPLWWQRVADARRRDRCQASVASRSTGSMFEIQLTGDLSGDAVDALRSAVAEAAAAQQRVVIQVGALNSLDAFAIGTLLLLSGHLRDHGLTLEFRGMHPFLGACSGFIAPTSCWSKVTACGAIAGWPVPVRHDVSSGRKFDEAVAMSMTQYLVIVWVRKWLVLAIFLFIAVAGVLNAVSQPRLFTAESLLVLDVRPDPVLGGLASASSMATQLEILRTAKVATRAYEILKLGQNPESVERWKTSTGGKMPIEAYYVGMLSAGSPSMRCAAAT